MAAFSDFLENEIISFFLRNDANTYTPPATVYVALFTADPTDAGSFTNEVAAGANAYARQSCAFDAASGGATANTAEVRWTNFPAETVTHFAICTAATAGDVLYHGALDASVAVTAGDSFVIAAGALDISNA